MPTSSPHGWVHGVSGRAGALRGAVTACGTGFQAFVTDRTAGAVIGCDSINPNEVMGAIILMVALDDTDNTAFFQYSIDGGSSYIPMSEFDSAVTDISGFPELGGGYGFNLNATAIPEPNAALLLLLVAGAALRMRER